MFRQVDGHYWVSSEALGYWFLRLNGFLTIPNFVEHPLQVAGPAALP